MQLAAVSERTELNVNWHLQPFVTAENRSGALEGSLTEQGRLARAPRTTQEDVMNLVNDCERVDSMLSILLWGAGWGGDPCE